MLSEERAKSILLVEDEAIIALMEKRILEGFGYRVIIVHSGEKAVELAGSEADIDLILMDIDLGQGVDGTEAARRILARREIPIAFLSSHTEPDVVERTENITSYGYIVKNSGETVLLASIRMAFRLFEARGSITSQNKEIERANEQLRVTNEDLRIANENLVESREKLQSIIRVAPTGIGVIHDRVIREVNEKICEMTGYATEELLDRSAAVLYATREEFEYVGCEKYRQIAECGTGVVETRWKHRSGAILDIMLASTPLDPSDLSKGVTFTALDITERKCNESALRESEALFRTAFLTSPDAVNINRLEDGLFVNVNEGFTRLTGYTREETIGRTSAEIGIWADLADRARLVEGLRERGLVENLEALFRRKDGSTTSALMSAAVLEIGGVPHILSITRDIEVIRNSERELREAGERYRAIFDNASDAIFLVDLHGRFLTVNRVACERLGYDDTELEGKGAPFILAPEDHERVGSYIEEIRRRGSFIFEVTHLTREGCRIPTEVHGRLITYGGSPAILAISRDISERKHAEDAVSSR